MRGRIFTGHITSVETRYDRDVYTGAMAKRVHVCASDSDGATVAVDVIPSVGWQLPAVASLLGIEETDAGLRLLWNGMEWHGLTADSVAVLDVDHMPRPMQGHGPGFGANVNHSWECPLSLQEEAQRRAAEGGMEVVFDVNKVTVKTARGTLHVTVEPPPKMAGFTADMCMLTWQVELRDLGLCE